MEVLAQLGCFRFSPPERTCPTQAPKLMFAWAKGQACDHEEMNINVFEHEMRIRQVLYAKNCEMT